MTQLTADRWRGRFTTASLGLHEFQVEVWVNQVASWRSEVERKLAAGQEDLDSEMLEGAALHEAAASRLKGPGRTAVKGAATALRGEGTAVEPGGARAVGRHDGGARRRRRPAGADPLRDPPGGRRPGARARRRLVRAVPALLGRPDGRGRGDPGPGPPGLRRRLPPPDSPHRPHPPQGAQQRARRAAGRAGEPLGDRERARRPHRGGAGDRDARGPRGARADGRRLRRRDRARLRDPVLPRPPVAGGAPRVVPPPPRRHAEVRGEPAQALPGHLQRQLRVGRLGGALGGAARGRRVLGGAGRADLPRRQPPHQADRLLGVAHPHRPRGAPGRRVPGRGVHQPGADVRAGEGRLQPVVHLLHVEELGVGAARVRGGARRPGGRLLPARTSS